MKITVYHKNSGISKKNFDMYDNLMKFLQKEYPLKNDLKIFFLDKRIGKMTTGSHKENHVIKILSKNRMNRDIMRTLTHEWVHEYQRDVLNREKGPNIGGKNENEANAEAGKVQKKFEKLYPNYVDTIYE